MEKYFYIVSHTVSEYSSMDVYIAETFEEAVEVIADTADWYCSKGSGWVRKVTKNMKPVEEWSFRNNEVIDHYVNKR